MKKAFSLSFLAIFSIMLCPFSYANESRILLQEVEVDYVLPKAVHSLQKKKSQPISLPTTSPRTLPASLHSEQSLSKPTHSLPQNAQSLHNTASVSASASALASGAHSSATQSNHRLAYKDVYALSPYAKYLYRGSQASLYLHENFLPWQYFIVKASQKYALRPELIAAVIKAESDFDADVVSPKGAQGLMQIMPATQDYLNLHEPFDPEGNIMAGSAYLREQLDYFGSEELALAAYNAGPGRVIQYKGIPPFKETQNYIDKVLQFKESYMRLLQGLGYEEYKE